jgi:micrococcal nuclease
MYEYRAKITRVIDGDTVDTTIDLGFGVFLKARIRIDDYDAPETWRPKSDAELTHGTLATKRAKELLLDKTVTLRTTKLGIYGRWGGSITLDKAVNGQSDFSAIMIVEGFSKKEIYENPKKLINVPTPMKGDN